MNIKKLLTDAAAIVDDADIQGMSAQVTVVDGGLKLTVRKANDKIGYWIDGTFMPEAVEADPIEDDVVSVTKEEDTWQITTTSRL